MKINVKAIEPILVIDRSKKDWEMNGRKGTTYKAICHKKIDEEAQVDEVRVSKEVYDILKPATKYYLSGEVDVKNGRFDVLSAVEYKEATK